MLSTDFQFNNLGNAQVFTPDNFVKQRMTQVAQASSYTSGSGKIEIRIPCNTPEAYYGFKNGYVYANVNIDNAAGNSCEYQGRIGSLGHINSARIETASRKQFDSISNYNVLAALMLSKNCSRDWFRSVGAQYYGTDIPDPVLSLANGAEGAPNVITWTQSAKGQSLAKNTSTEKLMTLDLLGFMSSKNVIPAGSVEEFVVTIELESSAMCFINAAVADSLVTFTNVYIEFDKYTLTPEANDRLLKSLPTPYRYEFTGISYDHQNAQIDKATLSSNILLACSRKKVRKIYMAMRGLDDVSTPAAKLSLASRNKANLKEVTVKLQGIIVNGQKLDLQYSAAQGFAEMMKSGGSLMNLHANSLEMSADVAGTRTNKFAVEQATATTEANIGLFFYEIDLLNGLDVDGVSSSGIDTIGKNLTLEIQRSAATTQDVRVDIYCEYESTYVLDMNGNRTWEVYS